MNQHLPTLSLDSDGHWEFILPAAVLPGEVRKLIVSEDGIYVEFITGDYDLVTWDDVQDIAVPGRLQYAQPSPNGHGWPSATAIYLEDSPAVIPIN